MLDREQKGAISRAFDLLRELANSLRDIANELRRLNQNLESVTNPNRATIRVDSFGKESR